MSALEVRPAPELEPGTSRPAGGVGAAQRRPAELVVWTRPAAVRYGVAALLTLAAGFLAWIFQPWLAPTMTPPFFVAVALAAWFGGVGPGLVATALSMVVLEEVIMAPTVGVLQADWSDVPRLLAFLVAAALVGNLSASYKRDELALRASEQRFRSMFETAAEGIWMLDRDGSTRFANDRMAALLGVPPDGLGGRTLFDVLSEADAAAARHRFDRALAGVGDTFDLCLRRADGGELIASVGISPVRDGAGAVVGVLGMFTDVSDRSHAERALEQANERFALAADGVQQLVYDWDLRSDAISRNQGLFQVVGYQPNEVPATGAWWREQMHPDDRPSSHVDVGLSAGDRYASEYRVLHRDGGYRTVRDAGRVVRDASGVPIRAVGSTVDITERKVAEEALRLLATAAETLAVDLDQDAAVGRVAGLAVPELADRCLLDLLGEDGAVLPGPIAPAPGSDGTGSALWRPGPDLVRSSPPRFEPDLATGTEDLAQADVAALRAEGVHSLMLVPLEAHGRRLGMMTLLSTAPGRRYGPRDLALAVELGRRGALAIENARLVRSLRAAEGRYHGVFAGAKDAILLFDGTGRIVEANPAALALTGYPAECLVGLKVLDLPAAGEAWSRQEMARLAAEGEWRGEVDLRREDETVVPVDAIVTAVALPAGTTYVGVLRDMTERRAMERLQEEFLAHVAHDLKNPLASVRGQAQLMRRRLTKGEPPDPDRLAAAMAAIDAGTERMVTMIDDLVDVARLRGGQPLELRRETVDLVALALRSVEEARRIHERHPLRFEATDGPVVGSWDGARLERVVANLLGNAIKYSPAGGEIVVRVRREAGDGREEAVLEVADSGVGIPASDLPYVFDRYRRGRNVGAIGGSGIGLAGARAIVEQHGGAISVVSAEGDGSTFTVRLPLAGG